MTGGAGRHSQGQAGAARTMPVAAARRGVSARAVCIGTLLMPVSALVMARTCLLLGYSTADYSLFENAVALLFMMVLANQVLRRKFPRWAFSPGEVLTIYIMMTVASAFSSDAWKAGGAIAATISYPFWFASDSNGWASMVWPILPGWLTVRNRDVLEGFYVGGSSFYQREVVGAWVLPAVSWAVMVGALMWVCLCLNSLVRRRWEDEERLAFPMAVLPVQLSERPSEILRNGLFWAGVGISGAWIGWNSLAQLLPALPPIPVSGDTSSYLANHHPWEFVRYTWLEWGPWQLGLCYLIPLDLAFSLVAFDLIWVAQFVLAGQFGWTTSPWSGPPYGDQQVIGAMYALLASVLWLDRRYLLQVGRKVLGMASAIRDESGEVVSYRAALLGAAAGVAFLWWMMASGGMQAWVIAATLSIYFGLCLFLSRARAQLGPPSHELIDVPQSVLFTLVGSQAMSPRSLGMMALMRPLFLLQRNNPAPLQLEALKMADKGRMERRRLGLVLALAAPLAVLTYLWAYLHLGYQIGVGSGRVHLWTLDAPRMVATDLDSSLRIVGRSSAGASAAMAGGAALVAVLMWLKLSVSWWPLHPVAYPLTLSWINQALLPALLATWLVKSMLLRYGGLQAHRRALPLFFGLLVGGAVATWVNTLIALLRMGWP